MEESEKQGYNALYGHTDSAFVQIPFDEVPALAEHLTQTVQREHQASHFIVEFEAFMPYWVTGGKNLYYGICSWPPEDEGKAKSARWGKISTLSPVSRTLEKDVLNMLCKGADENEVVTHVREISLRIKSGDIDIPEVSGVTRIQKDLWEYADSVGVPGVKGARYYNLHLSDQFTHPIFKKGDSVKWVYAKSDPQGRHIDDIVAYHETDDLDGFVLDHDKMVQKLVVEKIKPMFKAMKWSTDYASGMPRPKTYW
jgi:DNA polymerase elongation subunit (family B)